MVIDIRTRLPHTHLASHAANLNYHAQQLSRCAADLQEALAALQALDMQELMSALNDRP